MSTRRLVLLAVVAAFPLGACARQSSPPGGPPDNVPPVVASTSPDTFAVVEASDEPVVIRFSERISERPTEGAGLADAVVVSPATSALRVEHGRRSLEISLVQGWEQGLVYRVRVTPVIQDMFDNPMVSPFELVFSTGAEFSPAVVAGVVRDRITGEPVAGARVQAVDAEDPEAVAYGGRTDARGIYTLRYLSPGPYRVTAFEDRNRNAEPDGAEPRDSTRVMLESAADTVVMALEVLAPDTIPARLVDAEAVDSATVRLETDDFLDPAAALASVGVGLSREEGAAPGVDSLLHAYEWDARAQLLRQRAAAAADSAAADSAARADTTGRASDTVPPAPAPPELPEAETADAADTLAGPYGAGEPPRAEQVLYVLLEDFLEAEVEYEIQVSGITNIAGVQGGGGTDTVVWVPPPPDTAAADTVPADTVPADAPVDTVPADTAAPDAAPPEGAESDTLPPDTAAPDPSPPDPAASDTAGSEALRRGG